MDIIEKLNPTIVEWSNASAVIGFVGMWLVVIAVVGGIIASVYYRKKIADFLNGSWLELKKVEWLNRKMTVQYSIIVFAVLAFFTVFITLSDELFLLVRELVVNI